MASGAEAGARPARALLLQALALHRSGAADAAAAAYRAVLTHEPACFDALHLLGVIELQQGRAGAALHWLERALALRCDVAAAHAHRGAALRELGRATDALDALAQALRLDPLHAAALASRAAALLDMGRPAAALVSAKQALAVDAQHGPALYNRMHALRLLDRDTEALHACEQALEVLPRHAGLLRHHGQLLRGAGQPARALQAFERALQQGAADAALCADCGHVLSELGRHEEAAARYRQAQALDPALPGVNGWRLHAQLRTCDWEGVPELIAAVAAGIDAGQPTCEPFVALLLPLDRPRLRRCAEIHAATLGPPAAALPRGASSPRRLRLGYFSADFHEHPTAQLLAGVIEHHDRRSFEVTAFALGAMRARLHAGFDRFVELHGCSDGDAALRARQLGIDIAIDLGGPTRGKPRRHLRATRGATAAGLAGFSRNDGRAVVRLPAGRRHRRAAGPRGRLRRSPRAPAALLPAQRRSTPHRRNNAAPCRARPARWRLRLLLLQQPGQGSARSVRAVDAPAAAGARRPVLWLLDDNQAASARLWRACARTGHRPGAPGVRAASSSGRAPGAPARSRPLPRHLAVQRPPTGSDALWAGLPLLTLQGETFAARVGASLLGAVGLPELVTRSAADTKRWRWRWPRPPAVAGAAPAAGRTADRPPAV